MECGLVGDGEFVRPHGQAAPLLASGNAPLDGIALLVRLSVEAGRAPSGPATPQAVADLIGGLRDDRTDAASTEVPTNRAGRVGAIRQDDRRAGSWPAESAPRDPDAGHDHLEGRRVTGLARSNVDRQRPGLAVTGQVDLRAQATARTSERVVLGLGPARCPPFSGSGRMLVSPADGGVHRDGPTHVVISIRHCKNCCENPFPCTVHGPPDQTLVSGLKRSELLWQVAPGRAGAVLPRDGFQRPAVVRPPSSTDRIGRHQRLDPAPHRISDH